MWSIICFLWLLSFMLPWGHITTVKLSFWTVFGLSRTVEHNIISPFFLTVPRPSGTPPQSTWSWQQSSGRGNMRRRRRRTRPWRRPFRSSSRSSTAGETVRTNIGVGGSRVGCGGVCVGWGLQGCVPPTLLCWHYKLKCNIVMCLLCSLFPTI